MRIRNGAAFLEPTIRSHIDFFDEIVAVYNQCTDATPDILARLAQVYGPKLRVYHYVDRVFPQGSDGHIAATGSVPQSVVNYSNCALALTRFQIATKLDDDHLAIPDAVSKITRGMSSGQFSSLEMLCFSGLNLAFDATGQLAVPAIEPVSGGGDIGFFRVSEDTHFFHDPRFERFRAGGLKRRFAGFLYWHLKYLKPGSGFNNYELDKNPNSRFQKKRQAFTANDAFISTISGVEKLLKPNIADVILSKFSEKKSLLAARARGVQTAFNVGTVLDAVQSTTDNRYLAMCLSGRVNP